MIIKKIEVGKVRDSRGEETIEVSVWGDKGFGKASAPSGKSRGGCEAVAFAGGKVDLSVSALKSFFPRLKGVSVEIFGDLKAVEGVLRRVDKSSRWEKIGGNAVYALEAALLKALADSRGEELWELFCKRPRVLPQPLGNCIGGGMHSSFDRKPDFQEFLLIPKVENFFDAYFANIQTYKLLRKELRLIDKDFRGKITDESAWGTSLSDGEVLGLLGALRKDVRKRLEVDLHLGVDVAGNSLWNGLRYIYHNLSGREKSLSRDEQLDFVREVIEKHGLFYVEDPFHDKDFDSFAALLRGVSKRGLKCLICGDDLICTKLNRLEEAIKTKAINAVVVKPNQCGSLLEAKAVVERAMARGIAVVVSHRSGETMDDTIAHLAVGWQVPFIKTGIVGKEREAKLQRVLRIEKGLGR